MQDKSIVRILILGDVVGPTGCAMLQKHVKRLKQEHHVDFVIANGENSAVDGRGITPKVMGFFKHIGVDLITSGNHIFAKKDIYSYLNENRDLLRPANFPSECPGVGLTTVAVKQNTIGILNLQARIFMKEHLSCPFKSADTALTYLKSKTKIIIVDFHGETTAEKMAMAYYLDGRVSAVVGTHTHVQTADERILPGGTAYITDLGMAGALNSMIGMKKEPIIQSLITQMPTRFTIETEGPMQMTGVMIDIEATTGKADKIERISVIDDAIRLDNKG